MAGLDHVPAIVRQMADRDQLAIALVENVQRADLNAMEEAHAYRQLADDFGFTQDDIAARVGRARSTVANTLRLLELEPSVQQALGGREHHRGTRPRPGRSVRRPCSVNSSRPSWPVGCLSARPRSSSGDCETGPPSQDQGPGRRGRRDGASRRRPASSFGDQGAPRAVAKGRTHRYRVLQRRGVLSPLRPPDRRSLLTQDLAEPRRQRIGGPRRPGGRGSSLTQVSRPATTTPRASRSSRAWIRCVADPACTSARPMCAACITWSGRSSTTRSTKPWPDTPPMSRCASSRTDPLRVIDDGRGVPVGRHPSGKDALEIVHTVLHAGSKFGGGGYKVSGGLHGVGVSVVNALSEWLRVESARDGAVWAQEYSRGEPTTPVRKIGPQGDRRGTTTTFKADPNVFETIEFSFDTIAQRLRESAYLNKGLWIRLLDDRVDRERSFYFEGGLVSFVRHLNKNKETLNARPIYVERRESSTSIEVALQYNDSYAENIFSFANNINTDRRREPHDGLPCRPDPLPQRLRPPGRNPQGGGRQPQRRRRARGSDGGHQRQARRAAVRGPDQGQARQPRDQGPGGGGRGRGDRPVPRREPGRRAAHHREVAHRRAGPRGRSQGPRPRHPQGRPGRDVAAGQAGRLPGARPGQERAVPRRGRLGRRLGEARDGTAASRRSCRCAASSSTSRRLASTGSSRARTSGRS